MKKCISMLMAVVLLLSAMLVSAPQSYAAEKGGESRAIAIVFDNSGSMYQAGNQAWCLLILGVAINKKKKYSIILENGAPRISLIATFAHELTHIWQYTNWDNKKGFKKCPKSQRLLIYEGMAKWVEIQYLYLIGETNVAKREEYITRNRQDEYGVGFCLYEDQYPLSREAMSCDNAPFTTDSYPI